MPPGALSHPDFVGVRAKLERAQKHRKAFDEVFETYRKKNTEVMAIEQHSNGLLLVIKAEAFPIEIGLILGDMVNCMRGALDHSAFALMKWNTRRLRDEVKIAHLEGSSSFPICDSPSSFANSQRYIEGVSVRGKTVIERLQPYRDRRHPLQASPLRMLRELSNADKHRVLNPVYAVGALGKIHFSSETPVTPFTIWTAGPLEYGTGIAKVYFPDGPPPHVRVRGTGGIAPVLYDGWTLLGGVTGILDGIYDAVEKAVEQMRRTTF